MIRSLILIFVFAFVGHTISFAQQDQTKIDVITLRSGAKIKGLIIGYTPDGIKFMKEDESIIMISEYDVAKKEVEIQQKESGWDKVIEKLKLEELNGKDSAAYIDLVHLANGTILKGRILENRYDDYLIMEFDSGDRIRLEANEIHDISREYVEEDESNTVAKDRSYKQYKEKLKGKPKTVAKVYAFKERGPYFSTFMASISGRVDGDLKVGLGAHFTSGYQFNRWVGLGLGVGIDSYSTSVKRTVVPVFVEARGYFLKKYNSPYYSVNAGYGFALTDEDLDINEANGGYMVHPAIGYRFGATAKVNMLMDIGYKFQRAEFTREFFNGDFEVQDIRFQRFTFRLGLIF